MNGIYAILLAAGSGVRMGAKENKVFLKLAGRSVIFSALNALEKSGLFDKVFVVVRDGEQQRAQEQLAGISVPFEFVAGGKERQDSVRNGLNALPEDAEIVAIHDAARCLVEPVLIRKCVESALKYGSGVAGKCVNDTVKCITGHSITGTVNRENLVLIETPQAFNVSMIKNAYDKAYADGFYGTDEAMLLERLGIYPRLVVSDSVNIKLTQPADLDYGDYVMGTKRTMCIGQGFDAHGFLEGRPLILGGVNIESPVGLLGHSDADVLVHAVMDALLGASGLKDIGVQFPDSDNVYKDISSIELLKRVGGMLERLGAEIENIDATVVMERPKISPYRDDMRKNIAHALGIDEHRISIKATTTEGMGFIGRKEGAAAQAVCIVNRYL